jgi:hypothetical protein
MLVRVGVPNVGLMKKVLAVAGVVLGLFFIARAVAWTFQIDPGDAASYADDWGGPSLLGVGAVHCGPGIVSAAILIAWIIRGRLRARSRQDAGGLP